MRIERLDIFTFPVPFKVVFRHAAARRDRAENIIVVARSACGRVGYGEGCPRRYVTGETVQSSIAFIQQHAVAIVANIQDLDGLKNWIDANRGAIDQNPAAFCAIELALLDLLGKIAGRPIEDILGIPRLGGAYRYSAVLGDAPYLAYWWQFRRYRGGGFRDFKVKVSGNPGRDRRKIGVFRNNPDPALRVRLDANNLWHQADDCIRHINGLSYDFFAIEEPLQEGDLPGLHNCARRIAPVPRKVAYGVVSRASTSRGALSCLTVGCCLCRLQERVNACGLMLQGLRDSRRRRASPLSGRLVRIQQRCPAVVNQVVELAVVETKLFLQRHDIGVRNLMGPALPAPPGHDRFL